MKLCFLPFQLDHGEKAGMLKSYFEGEEAKSEARIATVKEDSYIPCSRKETFA